MWEVIALSPRKPNVLELDLSMTTQQGGGRERRREEEGGGRKRRREEEGERELGRERGREKGGGKGKREKIEVESITFKVLSQLQFIG